MDAISNNQIIHDDCMNILDKIPDNNIDAVITDPPYGYKFMGKDWDKAVPPVEVWKQCLRILKPGAWCLVMSSPRQDVLSRMIINLEDAGFKTDFTSIYWTYASGFPKAGNIGKMVDKKLGAEREVVGTDSHFGNVDSGIYQHNVDGIREWELKPNCVTPEAKALDGSYGGFQPKPAVEVIIVCMKPLTEKTYVDQAMKNGKGITWMDDCRIPYASKGDFNSAKGGDTGSMRCNIFSANGKKQSEKIVPQGRFPANLLVSNDVLSDSGTYSRFFNLDAWDKGMRDTFPFLLVPKASPNEKGKNNNHPTVKPLKLMRYLITLTTRPNDIVLDPFAGSGTTCVAAKELDRQYIGIDNDGEYIKIAEARLKAIVTQLNLF
jgi:site-specific DNA-methyltransferase (adenine-specific)